jgi:hypothetical protein
MKLDEVISKLEEIRKEHGGDVPVSTWPYEGAGVIGHYVSDVHIEVDKRINFYSEEDPRSRETFVLIK